MLEEWVKLRKEGLTYQAIADKYNVSKQAVYEALDKAGIKRKTKYSQYYKEWEELYSNGCSTQDIAKKYNCYNTTVHDYISKKFIINNSERLRRGWEKRRKNKTAETVPAISVTSGVK